MNKKLFILLAAMLSMVVLGRAQMSLKIPKWEKFVRITTDKVNLRKAPSTNSPKLVHSYGPGFCLELSWSAQPGDEAYHLESGRVLPVLKETGDWYCLYLDSGYEVYVMKRFCESAYPSSLWGDEDYSTCQLSMVNGNKGYLMGVYFLGSASCEPYCRIGHKIDHYIVTADYDGYGAGMEFAHRFITGTDFMSQEFHSERVTEAGIESFLMTQQQPTVFDIWIKFGEYDRPRQFIVDASTYKYPMETYTSDPISIRKFVTSATGQELQMREEPSLTAAKLIFVQEEEQSLYMIGGLDWDKEQWIPEKVTPATSKVFAVIGETDDWYEVYDSYNFSDLYSAVGYIQKDKVVDAIVMPITEDVLCDEKYNSRNVATRIIKLSPDNQFVISWGCPRVGLCISEQINIGRIQNNIALMCGNDDYRFDDEKKVAIIGNSLFYGTRLMTRNNGYPNVDFTKLTLDDARKLQRGNDTKNYRYAYVNINNQKMHIFELGRHNLSEIVLPQ